MTSSWPRIPVEVGDTVWSDGLEVLVVERFESDEFWVRLTGRDESETWHADEFSERARKADVVCIDSGGRR